MSSFKIIHPGIFASLQSGPVFGLQKWGISPGGPMDIFHSQQANLLVGNKNYNTLIEFSQAGIEIQFNNNTLIGLSAPNLNASINGRELDASLSIQIIKGDIIKVSRLENCNWAYLSISGEIASHRDKMNKTEPLKKNTIIEFSPQFNSIPHKLLISNKNFDRPIRIIKGPEAQQLNDEEWQTLTSSSFHILPDSNRMALKLSSSSILRARNTNIASSGVTDGTVQLLPDGNIVILMRDRQTIGGYARIAIIHHDDLSRLSQASGEQRFNFDFFKNQSY